MAVALTWDQRNRERRRELHKASYERNREKYLERRKAYYQANKRKVMDSNGRWRAKNPERVKLYRHERELLLKRGVIEFGKIFPEDIKALNESQGNMCNECDKVMGNEYTFDHIVPLSKDGPHALFNIQLLCHPCNSMKNNRVLESDIQYAILQYLKIRRIFSWKNSTVGIYKKETGAYIPAGMKGGSDIFALYDGIFYAIEVKRPGGKLTPDQEEFRTRVIKNGGIYVLATSLNDITSLFK